jgi:hypothetical protein
MWNIDLIQIQQYYGKQAMLKGGHIRERMGKRRKLRTLIWLMYSPYKIEYRIVKPVEATVKKETKVERKIEKNQCGMKCHKDTPCVAILNIPKCHFFLFYKIGEQESRTDPAGRGMGGWYPWKGGRMWGMGVGG